MKQKINRYKICVALLWIISDIALIFTEYLMFKLFLATSGDYIAITILPTLLALAVITLFVNLVYLDIMKEEIVTPDDVMKSLVAIKESYKELKQLKKIVRGTRRISNGS